MADSVAKQFIEYLEKCPHVSRTLDKFMEENCHLFAVGGVDHKMKHMELYNQYNELVENVRPTHALPPRPCFLLFRLVFHIP
jgi:hypothetical protein